MIGLSPLWLELRIGWYRWALASMGPLHHDAPEVVLRLQQLVDQRPRTEQPRPAACPPFMCAHDPKCPDRHCPGLHQRDGGMEVRGAISFPIDTRTL